jgi:hypothetical protein
MITENLIDERIQKMVDLDVPALDIIHGELKILMYSAEEQLGLAHEAENESGEAMDSMERKYWEGVSDAYEILYKLTYDLSFAIAERNEK